MAYPYQRSNFWDTIAQQRALGRRLSPGQTQAALTGERAGELQAYYDQSDRNRMRRLQEQQLALQEESQGSLEDYRNRQLEAQTGLSQQGLELQRQGQAADQGFRTQQAQAADAAARNQAYLGIAGLGMGALNYLGSGNQNWTLDANGRIIPRQSSLSRGYETVRDWFRPNEQAVSSFNSEPFSNYNMGPDYNFGGGDYGQAFDNGGYSFDFGSDFGGGGGYDFGGFDWGSVLGDVT